MADNTADSIISATEKYVVPLFSILALTTGTLLFWPSGATLFQLTRLPGWITAYAGLTFIVSVSVLFLVLCRTIYRAIAQRRLQAQYQTSMLKSLWALNGQERAILREFFLSDSAVEALPMQDSAVLSLRNKRILWLAARTALSQGRNMEIPFQLPERVRELIVPEMIDLDEARQLYNRDRMQFEAQRPHFRQSNSWY